MLKYVIQKITPTFVLKWYKERQYFKIIRDFDIKTEPDLFVARELADKEGISVDIGANIGLYTSYLSPVSSKVISIEPVPFTFSMLGKIVDRFELSNVETYPFAISDSIGKAQIEIPIQAGTKNYYRASLQDTPKDQDWEAKQQGKGDAAEFIHKIETKTIDSLLLDATSEISIIKCDVEGHELQCVKGAVEFLKRSKPAWMIEVSEDLDDAESSAFQLKALMESYNYKTYLYENEVLRSKKEGDRSVNYFFLQDVHLKKLKESSIVVAS